MRVTANLAVKGTRYYKATELFQKGTLSLGLAIRLEHQPNNPHDKNAVAVLVNRTGAMLGHISKELAPKYAALINAEKIIGASIANVIKEGECINIDLRVVYEQSEDQLAEKHNSRLWQSASAMPTEAGVYAIWNIGTGRQYIGSSINIKERIRSHIKDLAQGNHANHVLQSDFSSSGADHFEAKILAKGISPGSLATVEAEYISIALNEGAALYNLTPDGQGTRRKPLGYTNSEPISDRLAKEKAEAIHHQKIIDEQARRAAASEAHRKQESALEEKRRDIISRCEPAMNALIPDDFRRHYFFVGSAIALAIGIFFPKIGDAGGIFLLILGTIIITPFVKGHFIDKAKASDEYQSILAKRDAELVALEKGRSETHASTSGCIVVEPATRRNNVASDVEHSNVGRMIDTNPIISSLNSNTDKPAPSQPPESAKKKWVYDSKSRVLRNNNSGMEYFPKEYEHQHSSNTSGYQILHGPDVWVNDWDVDYTNDFTPTIAKNKPSSKTETDIAEIQDITGFAKELGLAIPLLLEQLQAAGVGKVRGTDPIAEQDKAQLLEHLRNEYKPSTTTAKPSPKILSATDNEVIALPASHGTTLQQTKALADQGNVKAQTNLGNMYRVGQDVSQDNTQALMWYRKAAAQGAAMAQIHLAFMYTDGHDVMQDYAQAMMWFRKAAAQGAAMAQYNLGTMYADGRSVPQDYVQAMMWYLIAKAGGITLADKNLLQLEAHSTSAQIAEAQKLAREWLAAHPHKN